MERRSQRICSCKERRTSASEFAPCVGSLEPIGGRPGDRQKEDQTNEILDPFGYEEGNEDVALPMTVLNVELREKPTEPLMFHVAVVEMSDELEERIQGGHDRRLPTSTLRPSDLDWLHRPTAANIPRSSPPGSATMPSSPSSHSVGTFGDNTNSEDDGTSSRTTDKSDRG